MKQTKGSFHFIFQVSKRIVFRVSYYALGENEHQHYATSVGILDSDYSDYIELGQLQRDFLNGKIFDFWNKYNKHEGDRLSLFEKEFISQELMQLCSEYNSIYCFDNGGINFSDIVDLCTKDLSGVKESIKVNGIWEDSIKLDAEYNTPEGIGVYEYDNSELVMNYGRYCLVIDNGEVKRNYFDSSKVTHSGFKLVKDDNIKVGDIICSVVNIDSINDELNYYKYIGNKLFAKLMGNDILMFDHYHLKDISIIYKIVKK